MRYFYLPIEALFVKWQTKKNNVHGKEKLVIPIGYASEKRLVIQRQPFQVCFFYRIIYRDCSVTLLT